MTKILYKNIANNFLVNFSVNKLKIKSQLLFNLFLEDKPQLVKLFEFICVLH